MFDLYPASALLTSVKTGQGLETVLPAVIERIPPPFGKSSIPLRMFLLDSYYDEYKGVIFHVAVVDGILQKRDDITFAASGNSYEASEMGIMHPWILLTGQVGYVVIGMRSTKEARVGDTVYRKHFIVDALPACKAHGVYSADGSDFEELNLAIERLTCNDASVQVNRESSIALGLGFRLGQAWFLRLDYIDVFHQRLEQEYEVHVISIVPTVPYIFEYSDGSKLEVQNPAMLPSNPKYCVVSTWEPTVRATIILPSEYVGPISAMRKNVLAKCYGGDASRKKKLLEKQKEGKKRMKRVGTVDIPKEAFQEILKVS
ncbi:translation factor GUF1 homolog, mitochondrial-like [Impatiens glandulifera]|uniref:translation factor GUF1 homolog, mitochondrial-like n=1 Tax=Impatiens glandulifera TaxID=253017 RepID=UPI001FB1025D|nr:translation factor GUF1 homolog, mitochondrial-like [Impatiens glandulifera]